MTTTGAGGAADDGGGAAADSGGAAAAAHGPTRLSRTDGTVLYAVLVSWCHGAHGTVALVCDATSMFHVHVHALPSPCVVFSIGIRAQGRLTGGC